MAGRKGLTGAGAASLAVMASLAGAPAASGQEVCVKCVPPEGSVGSAQAFHKIAELGFPGTTIGVFQKIAPVPPAFYKISELGFPGGTEDAFLKFRGD